MKLIKTKLLLKHNHNSVVGMATASHIDYCKYKVRYLKSDPEWSFKWCIQNFVMSICSLFSLLFLPILFLTNGLILYPYWIVLHIVKVKRIAKSLGIERINKLAKELVEECSKEK